MNRKARLAWELYLKMETSSESFSLLQLIANDCYKVSFGSLWSFDLSLSQQYGLTRMFICIPCLYSIYKSSFWEELDRT